MSILLDGTGGVTTPGVVNTAGETIATTLSVTGATNLAVSSGNVGIGTASPTKKLQVVSNTAQDGILISGSTNPRLQVIDTTNSVTLEMISGDSIAIIRTDTNHDLSFGTYGTERMRIDSSGNLLVGKTTGTYATAGVALSNVGSDFTASGVDVVRVNRLQDGILMRFASNIAAQGSISIAGSTTTYSTSSDYRLKEAVTPMTGALATVQALKPVTYSWKADGSDGQGFIAHELQAVVPDCVTGEKDATREEEYEVSPAVPAVVDADGVETTPAVQAVKGTRTVPSYQGIDTSFLVATLTAAIQEQQALITQLQADVAALKALSA
jgi:hypothetical protein